jgi:hypothetical protein
MAKKIHMEVRPEPAFFTLLGISCHLKDYRFSYLFNHHLGFSFIKRDDLRVTLSPNQEQADFSFYSYRNEERLNSYYLISNRSQSFILVPEMRQFDFLLIVEGKYNKPEKDSMMKIIRSLPSVLTIFEIKFTEIKNYELLLNDIEMHVMNIHRLPKVKYQPKLIIGGKHHVRKFEKSV